MDREAHITIRVRHLPKTREGEDFEVDYQINFISSDALGPGIEESTSGTLHLGFSGSLLAQWRVPDDLQLNLARRTAVSHLSNLLVAGLQVEPTLMLSAENAPPGLPYDLSLQIEEGVPHTVMLPAFREMVPTELIDPRQVNSMYRPFPPFAQWAATPVDLGRWEFFRQQLEARSTDNPELLFRSLEIARRAAAVETGAIEGLYDTDRGFTYTIASQAAHWEAALDAKGSKTRTLIQSQLAAYDYVLDFATQQAPIVEAWIRELHERLAKHQQTYTVYTRLGPQERPLPLGAYKSVPNHVKTRRGSLHAYAPVEATPMEMQRLIEEMRSAAFQGSHPILQASYAHYALAAIHPFADGNGRVARALGSVFTYRAASVPLLVLVDTRSAYYDALEAADGGDFAPFISFIAARAVDALRLTDECLRAALSPSLEGTLTELKALYVTPSGLTHQEIDQAGHALFQLVKQEIGNQLMPLNVPNRITTSMGDSQQSYDVKSNDHRPPVFNGPRLLRLQLQSLPPATASLSVTLTLEVPKNALLDSEIFLRQQETDRAFGVLVSELLPNPSVALQMRASIFVGQLLAESLHQVLQAATQTLRRTGY